jgi:hypothetical protein
MVTVGLDSPTEYVDELSARTPGIGGLTFVRVRTAVAGAPSVEATGLESVKLIVSSPFMTASEHS